MYPEVFGCSGSTCASSRRAHRCSSFTGSCVFGGSSGGCLLWGGSAGLWHKGAFLCRRLRKKWKRCHRTDENSVVKNVILNVFTNYFHNYYQCETNSYFHYLVINQSIHPGIILLICYYLDCCLGCFLKMISTRLVLSTNTKIFSSFVRGQKNI